LATGNGEITDTSGATVNAMQPDPFGQRFYIASTSAPRTLLALPGQIIDIADRHYNLYRDYDPTLGRYLQADPIGLDGGDNVYGYVGGNPVGWVGPEGLNKVILLDLTNKKNKNFIQPIASYRDIKGVCQVYGHGTPDGVKDPRTGEILSASELASIMRKHCEYRNPVYFYSCRTGFGKKSGAEALSKVWKGDVYGATSYVWYNKNPNGGGPDWVYAKMLGPDGKPILTKT